jgi:hypothetical protein
MKLICEVIEDVKYLSEAKEDGTKDMYIEGIFMQGNKQNQNNRFYSTEVLAKEVNRYVTEKVKAGRAYGELGHPSGPTINLERVSHMIKELRQDGDNFIGKAKLMDTPYGNIAKNLIKEGAMLGVSSRGLGSMVKRKDGVMEVQKDFMLATPADIVADPSAPDAFVQGVMEGVEWVWNNGVMVQKHLEGVKEEVDAAVRSRTLDLDKKMQIFETFLNKLSKS